MSRDTGGGGAFFFVFWVHQQSEDMLLLLENEILVRMEQCRLLFTFLTEGQRWAMHTIETNAIQVCLTLITSRK